MFELNATLCNTLFSLSGLQTSVIWLPLFTSFKFIIIIHYLADSATAKELLLMAPTIDEQKQWVMNLSQKVIQPRKRYTVKFFFFCLSLSLLMANINIIFYAHCNLMSCIFRADPPTSISRTQSTKSIKKDKTPHRSVSISSQHSSAATKE